MTEEDELSSVLDRIEEVEAGLDPTPWRRGHLIADVGTLVVVVAFGVSIDWHYSHPILLFLGLLGAMGLNRLFWRWRRIPQERERERLLRTLDERSKGEQPAQGDG